MALPEGPARLKVALDIFRGGRDNEVLYQVDGIPVRDPLGGRPLDVVHAVVGDGMTGAALVECDVDMVCFTGSFATGRKVARAVADGGVKVLEFTNRGDFACQIFTALVQWCESEIPDLILGVGSVIDPGTAALYINNGANFIVGPERGFHIRVVTHEEPWLESRFGDIFSLVPEAGSLALLQRDSHSSARGGNAGRRYRPNFL